LAKLVINYVNSLHEGEVYANHSKSVKALVSRGEESKFGSELKFDTKRGFTTLHKVLEDGDYSEYIGRSEEGVYLRARVFDGRRIVVYHGKKINIS